MAARGRVDDPDLEWLDAFGWHRDAVEFGEDAIGGLGPNEGFGIGIVLGQIGVDGGLEVNDRAEDAAAVDWGPPCKDKPLRRAWRRRFIAGVLARRPAQRGIPLRLVGVMIERHACSAYGARSRRGR